MREILFRGKNKYSGEWIEGYYCPCCFGYFPCCPAIIDKQEMDEGCWKPTEIIPESVGEFTGLTDKNGKRIFEGDICRIKDISYIDDTPFVVEWNNEYSGWFWRDISSATDALIPDIANMAKVIGNIHDNPELLKGGGE